MIALAGVAASPGAAAAPARVLGARELRLPTGQVADPEAEIARLAAAMARVADRLAERSAAAEGELAEILDAQALMALDPELAAGAERLVREAATPAARAVVEVGSRYAGSLAASDNQYLAARAADVREVCRLVAADLLGVSRGVAEPPGGPHVVVADDVGPADLAELDLSEVRGLATEAGSRTSHTAIVARALGIPAVVAVPGLLDAVAPGTPVLVDGDGGTVYVAPDAPTVAGFTAAISTPAARPPMPEAVTTDGHRVELAVNVGGLAELRAARRLGAASVGLFRTELAYLHSARPPTGDEQAAVLREMADLLQGGRLVVRTFDFGADKAPAFLPGDREPNPALGVRGIRLARRHPELLATQLRAVARAAGAGGRLAVMAPMVAGVEDAEWFLDACRSAGCVQAGVEIGVMVEIPSAVLCAGELAERLDFLSIGTNDLCQYLHAADRQVGALAALQDPFGPALLQAVRLVAEAAAGRAWVGVCGEAAADPRWAAIAVGLGVVELSMGAADLAAVRAELAGRSLAECRRLAERALAAP